METKTESKYAQTPDPLEWVKCLSCRSKMISYKYTAEYMKLVNSHEALLEFARQHHEVYQECDGTGRLLKVVKNLRSDLAYVLANSSQSDIRDIIKLSVDYADKAVAQAEGK
jgi:hypothetical protein